MQIVKKLPPNYWEIKHALELKGDEIFAYGDTIFNPSGKEIAPDIELHEQIHCEQQGTNPEMWWTQFLIDREFRLDQELETYAKQCLGVKKAVGDRAFKDCLDECAMNLSSPRYRLSITYSQAETMIRKRVKMYGN